MRRVREVPRMSSPRDLAGVRMDQGAAAYANAADYCRRSLPGSGWNSARVFLFLRGYSPGGATGHHLGCCNWLGNNLWNDPRDLDVGNFAVSRVGKTLRYEARMSILRRTD